MVITDKRFAAAYWDEKDHEWKLFDDIGCMIETMRKSDMTRINAVYVSDYSTGELIEARKAFFVVAGSEKLATPMGYGIVAFKDKDDALELARRVKGELIGFDELVSSVELERGG
jgi:copper chaperone NosL